VTIMNRWRLYKPTSGFTLMELLIVIAIIAFLGCLFLPAHFKAKDRSKRIACTSNLKIIGVSFRQWALDHTNANPMAISTNFGGTLEHAGTGEVWRHFQVMSNELSTPSVLVCFSDRTRTRVRNFGPGTSNKNISYFVGLDANDTMPQMFLAGDRNLIGGTMLPNRILLLTTNDAVRWGKDLHKNQGNVALADGSVQGFSSSRLQEALANSGVETNRLAMP